MLFRDPEMDRLMRIIPAPGTSPVVNISFRHLVDPSLHLSGTGVLGPH